MKEQLDTLFVAEVFSRYGNHLIDVITAIESNLKQYNRNKEELQRLASFKPEKYTKSLEVIENKIKEADIKLSYSIPRLAKLFNELNNIREIWEVDEKIKSLSESFLREAERVNK